MKNTRGHVSDYFVLLGVVLWCSVLVVLWFQCPEENHDLAQHDKCILIVIVDPLLEPGK